MNGRRAHIVVGVVPRQPAAVVTEAAQFARHFDADLVCAFVDAGRYVVEELPDGSVTSLSLNPDLPDLRVETFAPELRAQIAAALDNQDVRWSTRALAGGPAQALAHLADQLDAKMIVVGTREAGFRGTLHEFINGSVAAQLAHRQHRPVVVVPLNPVGDDGDLPWNAAE